MSVGLVHITLQVLLKGKEKSLNAGGLILVNDYRSGQHTEEKVRSIGKAAIQSFSIQTEDDPFSLKVERNRWEGNKWRMRKIKGLFMMKTFFFRDFTRPFLRKHLRREASSLPSLGFFSWHHPWYEKDFLSPLPNLLIMCWYKTRV